MHDQTTRSKSPALPTSLSTAFSQLHLENSQSDVTRFPTPPANAPDIQTASISTDSTNSGPGAQDTVDSSANIPNFEHDRFTLFPELPLELRRMVWRHGLPGPRFVEIRTAAKWVNSSGCPVYQNDLQYLIWTAVEKAPALFFTCHEARVEVMKFYRPLQGIKKSSGSVWFDPRTDVLCFRYDYITSQVDKILLHIDSALRESLENIVMDAYVIDEWYTIQDDLVFLLPSLKEIHITDLQNPGFEEYDRKKAVIALNVLGVLDEPEHYDMARKMIMDTKIKHPGWKEPIIKPGKCVVGSEKWVNAGIGLYHEIREGDEIDIDEETLEEFRRFDMLMSTGP